MSEIKTLDKLREAADTIESLRDRLQELQGVGGESRYSELFGTPERAARTLYDAESSACTECSLRNYCGNNFRNCAMSSYDALLKWLGGDEK